MNPEAQEMLKTILAKDVNELTEQDIAIMKARIAYIGKNSRAKFAEVLVDKPVQPQVEKKKKEKTVTPPQNEAKTPEEKKNDLKTNSADISEDVDEDEEVDLAGDPRLQSADEDNDED